MTPDAPDWVSIGADEASGQDLLGLRLPVQTIGNSLLNGVTSVTPKVRYLSFLCWIIHRYVAARRPATMAEYRRFAGAQEAAIVMANLLADRGIGQLVGAYEGGRLVDSGRRRLPLEPLVQQLAANIYANASAQLWLTHVTNSGMPGLTEQRGMQLAKAVENAIGRTDYARRLARDPALRTVLRSDLQELAGTVLIDKIPEGEQTIIIDALLPSEPVDDGERARLATYAVLLWLCQERGGSIEESDVFNAAREVRTNVPAPLLAALDGWLEYSIRDLIAIVHEATFGAMVDETARIAGSRGGLAPIEEVLGAVLGRAKDLDSALRRFGLLEDEESFGKLHFLEFEERIRAKCARAVSSVRGLRRWGNGLGEAALYEHALEAGAGSIALLPVAWCMAALRVEPAVADGSTDKPRFLLDASWWSRVGLPNVILPRLEEYRRSDPKLVDVMAELALDSVQQHFRIAWSRLSADERRDVSVLLAEGENWIPRKTFTAGRTASRFDQAIGWLDQLGLMTRNGLTRRGSRVLERSLGVIASSAR